MRMNMDIKGSKEAEPVTHVRKRVGYGKTGR